MTGEKVLIIGAGIAGSVLAFWLAKADYQVTVVERSRQEQKLGQGIEIEKPALQIVKAMGIHEKLKARRTGELGFELVDKHNSSYGVLEIGSGAPTGALELMRGDLCEILFRAADELDNISYHFETVIKSISQTSEKVTIELENRRDKSMRTEEYDYVFGADGQRSRTRELVFGSFEQLKCYKKVGAYNAYFSIPRQDQDWPYSKACAFPGRKLIWTRPTTKDSDVTSVYLMHLGKNIKAYEQANASQDRQKQKAAFAESFGNLGWESKRVVEQMMTTDNFYSDELEQVHLETWSKGRVALVGDSAWAPTPFTGQGLQCALIGAWVLAQEMTRDRSVAAFEKYEKRYRPYIKESQAVPLGGYAPYILLPNTFVGIWFIRSLFRMMAWFLKKPAGHVAEDPEPGETDHPFDLEMPEKYMSLKT